MIKYIMIKYIMIEYIIISKICLFSVKHEILLVNEINVFKYHYRYMKAYHDYRINC